MHGHASRNAVSSSLVDCNYRSSSIRNAWNFLLRSEFGKDNWRYSGNYNDTNTSDNSNNSNHADNPKYSDNSNNSDNNFYANAVSQNEFAIVSLGTITIPHNLPITSEFMASCYSPTTTPYGTVQLKNTGYGNTTVTELWLQSGNIGTASGMEYTGCTIFSAFNTHNICYWSNFQCPSWSILFWVCYVHKWTMG